MDDSRVLFNGRDGDVTYGGLVNALRSVKADHCDVLFIHTELNFGKIAVGMGRKELCGLLLEALLSLKVKTLIFPTFTFSFSNYQTYDVKNSKSKMGLLNEYVRQLPGVSRTVDPLMSVAVLGDSNGFLEVSNQSVGSGSIFDLLHKAESARFLFLGARIGQCFTHMHFTEEQLGVPYRYHRDFTGPIIDGTGRKYEDTYTLFVKYRDVVPCVPPSFEAALIEKEIAVKTRLGDSEILSMPEREAYQETAAWLNADVNSFLAEPYDSKPPVREYQFGGVTTVQ